MTLGLIIFTGGIVLVLLAMVVIAVMDDDWPHDRGR